MRAASPEHPTLPAAAELPQPGNRPIPAIWNARESDGMMKYLSSCAPLQPPDLAIPVDAPTSAAKFATLFRRCCDRLMIAPHPHVLTSAQTFHEVILAPVEPEAEAAASPAKPKPPGAKPAQAVAQKKDDPPPPPPPAPVVAPPPEGEAVSGPGAVSVNTLTFTHTRIDDGTARALSWLLPAYPFVEAITLHLCDFTGDAWGDLCEALSRSSVRRLDVMGSPLARAHVETLAMAIKRHHPPTGVWQASTALQSVSLRACGLADEAVRPLMQALASDPPLQGLSLWGNPVTPQTAEELLRALRLNTHLTHLSLAHTELGDAGLIRVAQGLSLVPLTPDEVRPGVPSNCLPRPKPPLATRHHLTPPDHPPGHAARGPQVEERKAAEERYAAQVKEAEAAKRKKKPAAPAAPTPKPGAPSGRNSAQGVLPVAPLAPVKKAPRSAFPLFFPSPPSAAPAAPALDASGKPTASSKGEDPEVWMWVGNRSIRSLSIQRNAIGPEAARELIRALEVNETLERVAGGGVDLAPGMWASIEQALQKKAALVQQRKEAEAAAAAEGATTERKKR
ncbi:hypothetical protein PAPYR_8002 [Paratrimastix pyriformis]|uniref:Uncharacterized protein n=1 Tax=Paratrimastix pyriformis TaxID=342808 RepID=A0ABQ8UE95_9EUKA|nr:hypothetical protein PAPYR_8002 [Paratrimastix pyriformis]